MNVVDENILAGQRVVLRGWRIRARQIGYDIGRKGMSDEEIIPLLRRLHRPTFFTRDLGLSDRHLCHSRYCVVVMPIDPEDVAVMVRRVLRHPAFDTQAKRMGTVIRASHSGLTVWRLHAASEERVDWVD